MEDRTVEEIARDAVAQIAEVFDKLDEEQNGKTDTINDDE